MRKLKTAGMTAGMMMVFAAARAQDAGGTDVMRAHGRIYVVMTVVILIVAGLFLYLLNLDRKISRLEKGKKE